MRRRIRCERYKDERRSIDAAIITAAQYTADHQRMDVDSAWSDYGVTRQPWASVHRGKWGQLTPPGKMDEKLKTENMQKEQFSMFMLYSESNQGRQV